MNHIPIRWLELAPEAPIRDVVVIYPHGPRYMVAVHYGEDGVMFRTCQHRADALDAARHMRELAETRRRERVTW
jgi:hypothetical protein